MAANSVTLVGPPEIHNLKPTYADIVASTRATVTTTAAQMLAMGLTENNSPTFISTGRYNKGWKGNNNKYNNDNKGWRGKEKDSLMSEVTAARARAQKRTAHGLKEHKRIALAKKLVQSAIAGPEYQKLVVLD
ncbi:hypothetical protein TSUD_218270 [Trifolium subterraneum]|uniref:Uncharacterized protein n=1 Tax=Trifolium subterraneum TaxID=3900 RepID=A0A2Z6NLQ0_TRISU|nr:hypothetical protein TSUD_218270 [Trifolium subterraneum]